MYRIVDRLYKIVDRLINRASTINTIITINTHLTIARHLFIAFVLPGIDRVLCCRPVFPLPHNLPDISHSGLRYVSDTDPSTLATLIPALTECRDAGKSKQRHSASIPVQKDESAATT